MTISDGSIKARNRNGAPLRFLLLFGIFWIAARVAWESYLPPSMPETSGPMAIGYPEIVTRNNILPELVYPPRKTAHQKSGAIFSVSNSNFQVLSRTGIVGIENRQKLRLKRGRQSVEGSNGESYFTDYVAAHYSSFETFDASGPVPDLARANEETPAALKKSYAAPRSRLSGYSWIFVRQDSGKTSAIINPASQPGAQYGASQMGAILSYKLSGDKGIQTSVYGRMTSSLPLTNLAAAAGVKLQPLRKIPMTIHIEQRTGAPDNGGDGTAIFAAGGVASDTVLPGIKMAAYAQAGYVAAEDSSYFFDLSATARKNIAARKRSKIAVGAGIWAGGQEDLARFDVGPTISVTVPVAVENEISVQADWRQKVAGNAEPGSSFALTISTGF